MPEQLIATFFEKGFFAAMGLICSASLAFVGLRARHDREVRKVIHQKIDDNHKHVIENHPTKDEFKIAFESLKETMASVQKDVREIRAKL